MLLSLNTCRNNILRHLQKLRQKLDYGKTIKLMKFQTGNCNFDLDKKYRKNVQTYSHTTIHWVRKWQTRQENKSIQIDVPVIQEFKSYSLKNIWLPGWRNVDEHIMQTVFPRQTLMTCHVTGINI